MWCCGKVDVVKPSAPPMDTLKVDVPVAAKPIVLVSRAPDLENQIVVVKKVVEDHVEDVEDVEDINAREEELTSQTVTALLGITLIFGVAYLAFNAKADQTFYIEAPHDL
jgi:phosphohistidine swiveling domain-containing protein